MVPTGCSIAGDTGGELAQLFMAAAEKFVGGELFEILKA
jgi:3-deoxy-D-manno-octulosonic-acid transferase